MKIKIARQPSVQGNTLVTTLVLGVIMLVTLISYLALLMSHKNQVAHSQSWNSSLTLAEAGVEEALAQLNAQAVFGGFANYMNLGATNPPPTDFSNNGWGTSSQGFGPMARTLGAGNYKVKIYTNASSPIVYSTGYVTVPITGDTLYRAVMINTGWERLLNVGVGAKNGVDGNGNVQILDSWNSHDPLLSTNGLFDQTKTGTNGNMASIAGTVDLGNDTITGSLYLGPTADYTSNTNQVGGSVHTDFNVQFPDVTLPNVSWTLTTPTPGVTYTNLDSKGKVTISTGSAYNFTTSGNYQINSATAYPIIVQPGVTVALNITSAGTFDATKLNILGGTANSGTAVLYLNGPTGINTSGNSAITASRPENLWIFGLPTLTSISFSGNAAFIGVLYAPEADITLNGGGSSNTDIEGAIVGNSVTFNGHFHVHYDQYLANIGPVLGYVATSWQELK